MSKLVSKFLDEIGFMKNVSIVDCKIPVSKKKVQKNTGNAYDSMPFS